LFLFIGIYFLSADFVSGELRNIFFPEDGTFLHPGMASEGECLEKAFGIAVKRKQSGFFHIRDGQAVIGKFLTQKGEDLVFAVVLLVTYLFQIFSPAVGIKS
jgi:hypothetical protein